MRVLSVIFVALVMFAYATAQQNTYTVIANPGENASRSVRINWHSDLDGGKSYCYYTECGDTEWKHVKRVKAKQEVCTVYDSMYSKTASGKDFYEQARFIRNTIELKKLDADTRYMYRVGSDNSGEVRYFRTAPKSNEWNMAVISDFHSYSPLPKRTVAAMAMLDTLENINGSDFDMILHVGDITAWGGSYSFWKRLYGEPNFKEYMWAGVNGNHDNMSRGYATVSNQFFRNANNNPDNGYKGEEGVCYHFTYGNTLFIMLNNESMRTDEGLADAQKWVRKVIKGNKAKFVVVVEHYQWFFATTGKDSQYARWKNLFDECGVDLAIGANHHVYARTNAIYQGQETDGNKGTIYIQTPSSDNERGQDVKEWTHNKELIKYRWTEGTNTVGALIIKATDENLCLTLYDRDGNLIDTVTVLAKSKN